MFPVPGLKWFLSEISRTDRFRPTFKRRNRTSSCNDWNFSQDNSGSGSGILFSFGTGTITVINNAFLLFYDSAFSLFKHSSWSEHMCKFCRILLFTGEQVKMKRSIHIVRYAIKVNNFSQTRKDILKRITRV